MVTAATDCYEFIFDTIINGVQKDENGAGVN